MRPGMKTKFNLFFIAVCVAVILSARAQGASDTDKKVALKIDYPPYTRVSGVSVIRVPDRHFEKDATPPVIEVPEGTVNLARGGRVTASVQEPVYGELNYITDGDKDGDEGYEVELAPGVQWVQIDLGKTSNIYAIAFWHFHRHRRAYYSVIVQVSNDAGFKKDVTTVFNNDYENKAGLGTGKDKVYIETNHGKRIPVNATQGRYVRLYSAGNSFNGANHYIEVEVYGKPVP